MRSLESIFGTVEVARTGYGAVGTSSLHPLDGALNLPPEKYSLAETRSRMAAAQRTHWAEMKSACSSDEEGAGSTSWGQACVAAQCVSS